jgi:class 3 adenylate cyclase
MTEPATQRQLSMRLLPSTLLALTGALTIIGLALLAITLSVVLPAEDFGFRGFPALFAITFSTVGWVLARRQPGNALGWLFAVVGILAAVMVFCQGYAIYGVLAHPGSLPWVVWAAWLYGWIWVPFATIVGVHALLLFPDGQLLAPGWRVVAWLGALLSTLVSAAVALAPGPLQNFTAVQNPAGAGPAIDRGLQAAVFGAFSLVIAASAFSLVLRFRRSTGVLRQQLKWIAYIGVVLAISVVPSSVTSYSAGPIAKLPQLLMILALAGIPVAVGVAVLRYRLYDIDLLINRTVVYGTVTAVLAAVFAVVNIALQRLLESLTGQHSDLMTGGLVVVAALGFGPMRSAVRPVVDRLLPRRAMLTLLFTDIVGSTEAIVELGDERWRALLARFRAAVRQELSRHGGREVNTAGDAFFATFDRPASGLRCAWAIRRTVNGLGLETRTGLHLGECEMRGEEVSGLAVHTAARVMSVAGGGEILISQPLRDGLANTDLTLDERGIHELKGVPGEWPLYAVKTLRATDS